ncbi:MAG: hypothetical protein ABR954_07735 [Dehalococcoidales bacterium]
MEPAVKSAGDAGVTLMEDNFAGAGVVVVGGVVVLGGVVVVGCVVLVGGVVVVCCAEEQPILNANVRTRIKPINKSKMRFIIPSPVFFKYFNIERNHQIFLLHSESSFFGQI